MDGKHFENGAFRKRGQHDNPQCDFLAPGFLNHKSKLIGGLCVFRFLQRSVNEKHLMGFHSENTIFKFKESRKFLSNSELQFVDRLLYRLVLLMYTVIRRCNDVCT